MIDNAGSASFVLPMTANATDGGWLGDVVVQLLNVARSATVAVAVLATPSVIDGPWSYAHDAIAPVTVSSPDCSETDSNVASTFDPMLPATLERLVGATWISLRAEPKLSIGPELVPFTPDSKVLLSECVSSLHAFTREEHIEEDGTRVIEFSRSDTHRLSFFQSPRESGWTLVNWPRGIVGSSRQRPPGTLKDWMA